MELQEYLNYKVNPGPLKIRNIQVMHGAGYFSGGPVVILRVDLCEFDEVFTNEIPNFYEELKTRLPTLIEHHCSVGKRGGFFQRVEKGTLLGHVTEHTAIELQTMAGMDVGYGKTRSTNEPGVYNVVFRFFDEVAGVYAGKAALNLVNAILLGQPFDVDETVRNLVLIRELRLLGPSTQSVVDEALSRGIPCLRLDDYNLVQLGTGKYRKRIRATITSDTSLIAVETADNKYMTTLMLRDAGVPVPETIMAENLETAVSFYRDSGISMVIKPCLGQRGQGVSIDLGTEAEIKEAFKWAATFDDKVLAQQYIRGETYRLLVINYTLAAAAKLSPPEIIGDGKQTISQLIQQLNADPRRGIGLKAVLTEVEADDDTVRILKRKGIDGNTVLPSGQRLALKVSGNLALGGSAEDVTDSVNPMNRFFAERAARVLNLNVAGVDMIASDISQSILDTDGVCIEVNAAPDFRMHLNPLKGQSRNVAKNVVTMLFPSERKTRIPVYSVTGTAGKTTTVKLLAHCLKLGGYKTGVTTTEGLFVSDKRLMKGDMTYPEHVALVLKDPFIDCAVLETSREGIIRRGLGYEFSDVGIVLNVHDDHVGSDDVNYLEDLAYAKSVVAEQVYDEGFTVLNADQELVMEMQSRIYSKPVLFSHVDGNKIVEDHIRKNGLAVVMDGNYVTVLNGSDRIVVHHVDQIPLLFKGKARMNLDNVLAATAALFAMGRSIESIRDGMQSFLPDPDMLPGRMNFFKGKKFSVLLDYAHNRIGFQFLKEFLDKFDEEKIGVLDAPGDRKDEEIIHLGKLAAETYHKLILYEDRERRGRGENEIISLLRKGALSAGFSPHEISTYPSAEEAWRSALAEGEAGKIIVILTERVHEALSVIRQSMGTGEA